MGTRNLTIVQYNNEIKVAQYGQWDGYPEGQGKIVLDFLRKANLDKFKRQLNKVFFIDETSPTMKKVDKAFKNYNKFKETFGNISNYEKQKKDMLKAMGQKDVFLYQLFTRDTCANILNVIYNAPKNATMGIPLFNSFNFAGDSLFCEWAYLINLDENTLEVYRGFNKKRLTPKDRFYNVPGQGEYQPIKLIKTYKLNQLPSEDTFIKTLNALANKRDKIN